MIMEGLFYDFEEEATQENDEREEEEKVMEKTDREQNQEKYLNVEAESNFGKTLTTFGKTNTNFGNKTNSNFGKTGNFGKTNKSNKTNQNDHQHNNMIEESPQQVIRSKSKNFFDINRKLDLKKNQNRGKTSDESHKYV